MILIDGIARSGTSVLGRLLARLLEPQGYVYYFEPFHHPTAAPLYPRWKQMIGRIMRPEDEDAELAGYLEAMARGAGGRLIWKEIRLALKQDWLLAHFPTMKIVHVTRDILGVMSSHCRPGGPAWMDNHRKIWTQCLGRWAEQTKHLREKSVPHLELLECLEDRNEFELYSILWAINEAFVWNLKHPRLMCLRHEDLCREPIPTVRRIADFLGIAFDAASERITTEEMADTASERDPSGPGPDRPTDQIPELWRERLVESEVQSIEAIAGAVRRRLEYPPPLRATQG